MIEFKQIVGRGTRLFEGKDYFTIYDFVKAYEHFNDPEWDGEPLEPELCDRCGKQPCICIREPAAPCLVCGNAPCICDKPPHPPCEACGAWPCVCDKKRKIKIKLADGKERTIQHMMATSFWSPDGKPMSAAEFIERLFGELPGLFKDEDELRALWSHPETRGRCSKACLKRAMGIAQLAEIRRMINAENSDLYDVLGYIAFALDPITRQERVALRQSAYLLGL